MFLHADSKDAQADLSLRWAQRSFCWFCREAAHLCMQTVVNEAIDTKLF